MSLAIGVDLGGTNITAGLVGDGGELLLVRRRPTPPLDPSEAADVIADLVAEMAAAGAAGVVNAVGVCVAGMVTADRSSVSFAANLGWRDVPLRMMLEQRLGLPVVLENDANAAGWAESQFGAGAAETDLVMITLGTGVGSAFILNGRLVRGRWGMAGEAGHMRVVPDGRPCGCGDRGCWEQYCSGNALALTARSRVDDTRHAEGAGLLQHAGGAVHRISGHLVSDAARAGNPLASTLVAECGHWLGVGLAMLATLLDPGMFVIGGGVANIGEPLLAPARAAFAGALTGRDNRPHATICTASLADRAGLIGAGNLALMDAMNREEALPAAADVAHQEASTFALGSGA